jgi:long-chain acyl-CoA synthetase
MYPKLTSALQRAAQIRPRGLAVSDVHGSLTWPEFTQSIAKAAFELRQMGVATGDRVAILSDNSSRFLALYFAAIWAGAIAVPLNTRTGQAELNAILDDCRPAVLAASGEFEQLAADVTIGRPVARSLISLEAQPRVDDFRPYESLLTENELADGQRGGDDIAAIYYTGGTTGVAKGVMLSHSNLVANAFNMVGPLMLGPSIRNLHATPMFHIAACAGMVGTTLVAGSHYFVPRFDPGTVLHEIGRSSITHVSLVPTMVGRLAAWPRLREFDVHSLQVIFYGGSLMPERLIEEVVELMPTARLVQGYGLTETSPTLSLLTHEDHVNELHKGRRRSAGQASLGIELAILDESGRKVEPGVRGEICARGATITQGYWEKPELTTEALRGGWFHSGDIGVMDNDGYLYVIDRLKDMIITGGENVYSIEVENVIFQHPAVDMCAVIGLPSATWGESVHAVVSCRAGTQLTQEEILQCCRKTLANYKVPKTVDIRTTAWPMSAAGKVLKSELKKEYSQYGT